jgi:hypothetical protein
MDGFSLCKRGSDIVKMGANGVKKFQQPRLIDLFDQAENSELTACNRNTNRQAALPAFASCTFTVCATWFVMTRHRRAGCSGKIRQGWPGTIA